MPADKRTQCRLDQTIGGCLCLFLADPYFAEREREIAEALGYAHLEFISEEITKVLLKDFRIDAHRERKGVKRKVEETVHDVLFDRLIAAEIEERAVDTEEDILVSLSHGILKSLVSEHQIEVRD